MALHRTLVIALSTTIISTASFAQGLNGSTSITAVYCCVAPTEQYRISNFVEAVVGSSIEVPPGALVPIGGFGVIPVTMDITNSTIVITYTANAQAASGAFNGYLFQFEGAPSITGVSLDPSSSFTPVSVGYTENSVFFNAASLAIPSGGTSILNVSVVPEAPTLALMLGGMGVVASIALRRREA